MYFAVLLNFIFVDIILDLYCFLIAKVSYPYNKVGNAKGYIYIYIYSIYVFLDFIGI